MTNIEPLTIMYFSWAVYFAEHLVVLKLVASVIFWKVRWEQCQEYFQSIPTRGDGHFADDQDFPEYELACQARLLFLIATVEKYQAWKSGRRCARNDLYNI